MKELFPPSPPTAGAASHHQQQHPYHHHHHQQGAAVESDVSMDDLSVTNNNTSNNHHHSQGMQSNTSSDNMAIASPPRTVMRSTARRTLQGATSNATAPSSTLRSAHASRIRSRLFEEEDEEEDEDDILPTALHRKPSILKPLDLNLEFASSEGNGGADGDPDGARHSSTSATLPSQSTPSRHTLHRHNEHHHHRNTAAATSRPPDTKTPHRPVVRKRQAEQHDLYGKHNLSFERDSHDYRSSGGGDSIFSAAESPVDMYASPRISPSSPPSGGNKSVDTLHSTTNAMGRMAVYKSPYRQVRGGGPSTSHKSPSFIRTLDGRTVQSKNPFSPMINFDDTLNESMLNTSMDSTTTSGGQHVSSASAKMQVRSSPSSPTAGGNTSLFLNMSDTTPLSFPASLSGRRESSGSSGNGNNTSNEQQQQRAAGVLLPRHKLSKRDSSNQEEDIPISMGMAGLAPIQSPQLHSSNDQQQQHQNQKESYYTRDGYPEKTGRYSYTGSPIKEHLEFQHLNDNMTASARAPRQAQPPDVCTNIRKIRRRTKGDDVVAAAAHGEPTWKRQGMYIYTNKDNNNNNDGRDDDGAKSPDDNISPTDVAGFPLFRPTSSDTHTLPPTPTKPVRRPPSKKYTPIRKPLGPPPTPMPAIRKARSFDHDDDDDEFEDERRGFRRHSSGNTMDYLSLSPGGEGGQMLMVAAAAPAAPPSRFYSDFDTISELGNGSFGNVYKVLSRLDGCMYAIKVAHRPAKGMADKDRMLKEVYALAALSDQADTATFHIVRYHQAWMEENRLYIQTELCTTTLQAEMSQSSPMPLPLNRRYKCLREILLALEFIHKNGMVHLDIKPENVFLKNDQFKLGDFGLVSKISSHDVEEGDSRYMSMELLGGDHADLTKSDIFSLGITMYELCLGGSKHLPSNGPEWQSLRSGDVPQLPDTPEELHKIILMMMHPTYQERPCASELLKKPQLLSDEQKMLVRERNKVWQANLALAAQSKQLERLAPAPAMPKKGLLTRRNTWSHLG